MRERKLRRDGTGTAYTFNGRTMPVITRSNNGRTMPVITRSDKSASKGEPS